jgi:hypothetical protein
VKTVDIIAQREMSEMACEAKQSPDVEIGRIASSLHSSQ